MRGWQKARGERASVVLVALCCVTVLGIALASYLAISGQAVKLSNRSYLAGVSKQLAEAGLEQTLWSFNRNEWDPSVWTIDPTNHRATRTLTFPTAKYGNNVVGSINVRVDNFDSSFRGVTWTASPSIAYVANDLVSHTDGMWYRCIQSHTSSMTNAPGNLAYWVPAPIPWKWSANTTYRQASATTNANVVFQGGTWYFCINTTSSGSFNGSDWTAMPIPPSFSWASTTNYPTNAFVYEGGTWYRSTSATNTGNPPPDPSFWSSSVNTIAWAYRTGVNYGFNDVVYARVGGVDKWYRCVSSSAGAPPTGWEDALNGSWGWSSSAFYNLNDTVYYGGSFYRCIRAHAGQTPPAADYWTPSPLLAFEWEKTRQYNINDVTFCNGTWYLCLVANTDKYPGANSDIASGFWAPAPASLRPWDSTRNYGINDCVSFGGLWYRCIVPHLNQPTTNAAFWAPLGGATLEWDPAVTYSAGNFASYGGAWYLCVAGHSSQTPNNSAYWSAVGAPVIYAEGVAAPPDSSAPIRTQVRARVARAGLFPNAAAANSTMRIVGAGTVDSYDSITDPTAATRGYAAVLASAATANPAMTVTGTRVNGYIAVPPASTSPYDPAWNYGGSAVLTGTLAGSGIDLKRVSRSPYVPTFETFPKPSLATAFTLGDFPAGTALSLANTLTLGSAGAVTPSRYYYDGNLDIGSAYTVNSITITGPVILFVNGYIRIRSGGRIEIKTTGSAEIHCGYLRTYSGSDGIFNRTLEPRKLIVIADTASASNIYLDHGSSGTNPNFYGAIYAPNTTASAGVEVRTGIGIYGALSARKVTFSAEANVHYDTSLRYATFGGIDTPFTITEWRELTDQAERVTLP